jgi:hypothetical protein
MPALRAAATALLLGAALSLTSCGQQHGTDPAVQVPGPSVPGVVDGAPHNGDNNAYRRTGEMSPASAKDAQNQADRIEPVLKRLWEQKKWDPQSVRTALLALGYQEARTGGPLTVKKMDARFETDHYVTPEGALIGLRVHDDACVTAFVQKSNYGVKTNGPFLETGCFEPPYGH